LRFWKGEKEANLTVIVTKCKGGGGIGGKTGGRDYDF
jgi:hypothetical protein